MRIAGAPVKLRMPSVTIKRGYVAKETKHSPRVLTAWAVFFLAVYLVLLTKFVTFQDVSSGAILGVYSIAVGVYILGRFALSYFYEPHHATDRRLLPTITFAIPVKNEEGVIRETILRAARSDYPAGRVNIIVVNDGSTDGTLAEILLAKEIAEGRGIPVEVVDWPENRGKRQGMAECIRRSDRDLVVFVDSDTIVTPTAARELAKYFVDDQVAAVAGHGYVANGRKNFLTKMQEVRYFVSFKAYKAAEALFGAVTCCSGCCSAYRRSYLLEVVDSWRNETFAGMKCTYGDDRSLTNIMLQKGYKALYAPEAAAYTFVPETFGQFMRQQLRWKKSWFRESLKASLFMWKRNPIAAFYFYLGFILTLAAPAVAVRALIWYPTTTGAAPFYYLFGLLLMAILYGLYYYVHTGDKRWVYGPIFGVFYSLVLVWQLPYAILNLGDSKWGTR